ECCVAHQCESCEPPDAGPDTGPDAAPDGSACQKTCATSADCDDGVFCNGQEQCDAGCCAPPLDVACNSHSPCIMDGCDEVSKTCLQKPTDADGDKYVSSTCGGDDCDDGDPTVYPGHAEVHDGKDNDCNGLVDDRVAQPKG